MKKTFVLVFASTALTAAIGAPAFSAMQTPSDTGLRPIAALFEKSVQDLPLIFVSDDDDDDDRHDRDSARRGHDDDDDEDDDCEDDDGDDDDCGGPAVNPAPAGAAAPPPNALIGNGAPPQVELK